MLISFLYKMYFMYISMHEIGNEISKVEMVYKVTPPEFADFKKLRAVSISDYHGQMPENAQPQSEENAQPQRPPVRTKQPPQTVYQKLLHIDEEEYEASRLFTEERFHEIQNELNKGDNEKLTMIC